MISARTILVATLFGLACFVPAAHAQDEAERVSPEEWKRLMKESKKRADAERKAQEKQWGAENKEKLKRPAEIVLSHPAKRVRATIVGLMADVNYTLDEGGEYRLAFSQEIGGFKGDMARAMHGGAYSDRPRRSAVFTVIEQGEASTRVVADLFISQRMANGNIKRVSDMNKNKEWRRDFDAMLARLAAQLEATKKSSEP